MLVIDENLVVSQRGKLEVYLSMRATRSKWAGDRSCDPFEKRVYLLMQIAGCKQEI
jgi:hypothetical protein